MSQPGSSPETQDFLNRLEDIYRSKERLNEFEAEKPIYDKVLPQLQQRLGAFYRLIAPMNLGSTATVWEVLDIGLDQRRALKLSRPRADRLERIVKVIRAEPKLLAGLQH